MGIWFRPYDDVWSGNSGAENCGCCMCVREAVRCRHRLPQHVVALALLLAQQASKHFSTVYKTVNLSLESQVSPSRSPADFPRWVWMECRVNHIRSQSEQQTDLSVCVWVCVCLCVCVLGWLQMVPITEKRMSNLKYWLLDCTSRSHGPSGRSS